MGEKLDTRIGGYLVKLARTSITEYLRSGKRIKTPGDLDKVLEEKSGAFVTLKSYPSMELRGCIGRPYPSQKLVDAVIDSAIDSAVNDPRFPPVSIDEIDKLVVEVSVLTKPEEVRYDNPLELRRLIKIGRDGLIIEWRYGSGLLLPQVPVEEGWDVDDFLTHACIKAGAPPDCWIALRPRVYRFQAVVFEEEEPSGRVVMKKFEAC